MKTMILLTEQAAPDSKSFLEEVGLDPFSTLRATTWCFRPVCPLGDLNIQAEQRPEPQMLGSGEEVGS